MADVKEPAPIPGVLSPIAWIMFHDDHPNRTFTQEWDGVWYNLVVTVGPDMKYINGYVGYSRINSAAGVTSSWLTTDSDFDADRYHGEPPKDRVGKLSLELHEYIKANPIEVITE